MNKKLKYNIVLARLRNWLRSYFRQPVSNIRTATIIPGDLYHNFGHVCMAVPHTADEANHLLKWPPYALPPSVLADKPDLNKVDRLYISQPQPQDDCPARCMLCDFYRLSLPCPLVNAFADGTTACLHYKYVIVKKNNNV
jgi:hypothetical protein